MKNVKLRAMVEIEPFELISELTRDETMDFICAIDLSYSDVGFTDKLIMRLIRSIKNDLSSEEWEPYQKFLDSQDVEDDKN